MNTLIKNWTLALAGVCAIMAATALLDGPSDAELARMTAADLADATKAEQIAMQRLERCRDTRGPRAEVVLAGINGQDFVCRVTEGI
jgi:hypothetical protein